MNPFFEFGPRPFREARLRSYVIREHRRGRQLLEILQDAYVSRCGSAHFCWRVLQDHRTLEALLRNDADAIAAASAELAAKR